jgi:A/G-specific adenine glycosylase
MAVWAGLGYYARARTVQCARAVVVDHGGTFLETYDALIGLPGIGPYHRSRHFRDCV